MNLNAYQQLLLSSYESNSEENRQIALHSLLSFIQANLKQVFQFTLDILSNSFPSKIKFLSISLIRQIYRVPEESQLPILIEFSHPLFNSSFSLIQSEICLEIAAVLGEILVFLSDHNIDIKSTIEEILSFFPQVTIKRGIFEIFIILCENIELDSQIVFFFLNFFSSNPSYSNDFDLIAAIQFLTQISTMENFSFDEKISMNLFPFLINYLNTPNIRIRESVYICLATFCKYQLLFVNFIDISIISQFILSDLSQENCIKEISLFIKKIIKYHFEKFSTFIINMIPIFYSISIAHKESEVVDFGEEKSIDHFAALSVIEYCLKYHPDQFSQVLSFLDFDSSKPQIREISFRLLSSIFEFVALNQETLLLSLKSISIHMFDINRRVIESSLWALLSFCCHATTPLEFVMDFFLQETGRTLFDCLSIYFDKCEDKEMAIVSAISIEIICIFALENVYNCFEMLFNQLFQFHISLINTNLQFIKIRIEKALLTLISSEIQSNMLLSAYHFLHEFIECKNENEFNFLCELICAYFSFHNECDPNLIPLLINDLQTIISSESISSITALYLSQEDQVPLDRSFLFHLFESNTEIAIDSIILYSIEHLDLSLLTNLNPLIDDKHQQILIPLIEKVERENEDVDQLNIPILNEFYDSCLFSDYIRLISAIISVSESPQPWIEFAIGIFNKEDEEIIYDSIIDIVQLFESFAASDLETFQRVIIESQRDKAILISALEIEDISQTAKLLLTMLEIPSS